MKKNYLLMGLLALGLSTGFTSCGGDDEPEDPNAFYYDNSTNWGKCAAKIATVLEDDATNLYDEWDNDYAEAFKEHNSKTTGCKTSQACVALMLENCVNLASSLESSVKDKSEAKYAAQAKEAYKNNIKSMANLMLGVRLSDNETIAESTLGKAATHSLMAVATGATNDELLKISAQEVWKSIANAYAEVNAIGESADQAAQACADMVKKLNRFIPFVADGITEEQCSAIVAQFTDNVVCPTYRELKTRSTSLCNAVRTLRDSQSNSAFAAAAAAWTSAHSTWEMSEAFTFGPASKSNYTVKLDYSPANESSIKGMISSGNYDKVTTTSNVRGFHALEYLLFKDGEARKTKY